MCLDYDATSENIIFSDSELESCISIQLNGDSILQSAPKFFFVDASFPEMDRVEISLQMTQVIIIGELNKNLPTALIGITTDDQSSDTTDDLSGDTTDGLSSGTIIAISVVSAVAILIFVVIILVVVTCICARGANKSNREDMYVN